MRAAWGSDANRFATTIKDGPQDPPDLQCAWDKCINARFLELPLCFVHSWQVSMELDKFLLNQDGPTKPPSTAFVYYLMVGPSTVKIGFTQNLVSRIKSLRSELQYVVALEPGGRDLERVRHEEFAAERIGRREDFQLSDRLTKHIEELQRHRDELIAIAQTECGRKS